MQEIIRKDIEIPKFLYGNLARYKVVSQSISIDHLREYSVINHEIILKFPRFCTCRKLNKILRDIQGMCDKMKDKDTMASMGGWDDSECKTYRISIHTIMRLED